MSLADHLVALSSSRRRVRCNSAKPSMVSRDVREITSQTYRFRFPGQEFGGLRSIRLQGDAPDGLGRGPNARAAKEPPAVVAFDEPSIGLDKLDPKSWKRTGNLPSARMKRSDDRCVMHVRLSVLRGE